MRLTNLNAGMKKIFQLFIFNLILISGVMGKVNKGIWYYQQPTRDNDHGLFYVDSTDYEGFCGLVTSAMGLQYFIPNIHTRLYQIYGAVDFHPDDKRGGLKNSDPFIYNPLTTYPFEDFLGHKYIGRHVTTTGISYKEMKNIFIGVDADLPEYECKIEWVHFKKFKDFLDDGWLIIMNSRQGGGHYILIVGWDGNPDKPDEQYFYIWDPWKEPLTLEDHDFEYVHELVGNKNNPGTAKKISAYKINGRKFKEIFKDQREDSTAFAFRFKPERYPVGVKKVAHKGIWMQSSDFVDTKIARRIKIIAKYGITDIFYSLEQEQGNVKHPYLKEIIKEAHKQGLKVHACVTVLKNNGAYASGKYRRVDPDGWLDVEDKNYQRYFIEEIIQPLIDYNPDGIVLDYLWYPNKAGQNQQIANSITDYIIKIKNVLKVRKKQDIQLGAVLLPRTFSAPLEHEQDITAMSAYLNMVVPLTFTHRYRENPIWVGEQVKKLKARLAQGCEIWSGFRLLDDDQNFMTPLEMQQIVDFALFNGASGVMLFGYPLTNWQWEQVKRWERP
ncbi:cysteine peptidase family C39 domain-containing protein [Calditrichota bacterium GD2]